MVLNNKLIANEISAQCTAFTNDISDNSVDNGPQASHFHRLSFTRGEVVYALKCPEVYVTLNLVPHPENLCAKDLPVRFNTGHEILDKYLIAGSRVLSNNTEWSNCKSNELTPNAYKTEQGDYVALNPNLIVVESPPPLQLQADRRLYGSGANSIGGIYDPTQL